MGLKSILRSLFLKPAQATAIPTGQLPTYPTLNQFSYIQAYSENASVYTIVSLMSKKFATLPRYLCQINNPGVAAKYKQAIKVNSGMGHGKLVQMKNKAYVNEMSPVVNNPLMDLLNKPNPYMGQDSFYALIYTYKKVSGNSFVWLNRGAAYDEVTGDARYALPVSEMYVLPSQYMSIRFDQSMLFGDIVDYVLLDRGAQVYFHKEDIIHWRDPNPKYDGWMFTHFYGISPLEPGMPLIVQDKAGRDAMVAMYQNGGARGVLFNKDYVNETPEQASARKSAIDTKINNRAQKSAVASLAGDWGYLQLGDSAVDMEFVDTMDKVFQRVCNLLGCNPQLFETKTTFNNVEQARKDLITNAIMPDACSYRDEENRVLLRAFKLDRTKYAIDIDASNVPELQDDMQKLTATIMSNQTLTINEKRQELGFDPLVGDEFDTVFIPNNLISAEDAAVPTATLSNDTGDGMGDPSAYGESVSDSKQRLLSKEVAKTWNAVRVVA